MVTQGTLAKAAFWNEDKNTKVVDCMFNPDKYNVAKTVNVMSTSKLDQDVPDVRFGGSQDTKITISELWFDTWGSDPVVDVRTHTDKVFDLMKIDSSLQRPPNVSFRWGKPPYPWCAVQSVTQDLVLFASDGTPLRAKLNVAMTKTKDGTASSQGTNPTSFARGFKVRTVMQGETLDVIAYQEYGDSRHWRVIADFNSLADPLRLRPGQRLALPPLNQ